MASAVLKNGDTIAIGEAKIVFRNGGLDICSNFCAVNNPALLRDNPMETVVHFERSTLLKMYRRMAMWRFRCLRLGEPQAKRQLTSSFPARFGAVSADLAVTLLSGMNPIMLAFSVPMAVIGIIISVTNYRRRNKIYRQQ